MQGELPTQLITGPTTKGVALTPEVTHVLPNIVHDAAMAVKGQTLGHLADEQVILSAWPIALNINRQQNR